MTDGLICPCDDFMVITGSEDEVQEAMSAFCIAHDDCAPGLPSEIAWHRFQREVRLREAS